MKFVPKAPRCLETGGNVLLWNMGAWAGCIVASGLYGFRKQRCDQPLSWIH